MVEKYTLLNSQKNEVFEILQEMHLEPANFSWVDEDLRPNADVIAPRLNYLDGDYFFQFKLYSGTHYSRFRPGLQTPIQNGHKGDWEDLTDDFKMWAHCVRREIEAPDWWKEMHKYQASVSLAIPEQLLNEPIPAIEADKFSDRLSLLADKIEEQFKLNAEESKFVRNKLNYLAEAAKRQRSADWVHTSIGVFVAIAMGLSLAPDRARELWQLIENIVGPFIHLLGS